jgi:UDP:flavonoid glycosyltransferase YjiC (YdhE family)
MDKEPDKKLYALSEALCPRKLHLRHNFIKDVCPKSWKLAGVIREPPNIFPAALLPMDVASFLEAGPVIVVTLSSSHLGSLLEDLLCDRRCLFVSSTVDMPLPGHMHWPGQLDLDAVFAKASLIIHACGVGTAYQAVCAGKPSICVTLTKEQVNNAQRLVYKGAALHFPLVDLKKDQALKESFANALDKNPFSGESLRALQAQAMQQGNGLDVCVQMLADALQRSA